MGVGFPLVNDNQQHRMGDAPNKRLGEIGGKPLDIARTQRSALDLEAQPYQDPNQDLIDRIPYRMAGLTEAEAHGLEERLESML